MRTPKDRVSFARVIPGVALLAVLLLVACAPAAPTAAPQSTKPSPPLTIAVLAPFTGPYATVGKPVKETSDMAVADINAAGGIGGRQLQVISEDSGESVTTALNALNKVLEQKPAVVLGATISPHVAAMIPVATKEGVPLFISGTGPSLLDTGSKWVFAINPTDDISAGAATKYAVEKLGVKQLGFMITNDDAGQAIIKVVQNTLQKYNQTPLVELYGPADKDMSAQLLNLKNKGANGILVWGNPLTGPLIVKQAKQLQIGVPILSNIAGYSEAVAVLTNDEAQGLYGTATSLPTLSQDPTVQAWVKRYKERYNSDPGGTQTHLYDVYMILAQVMAKTGDDRAAIQSGLANIKGYKGISGEWTIDSRGLGRHDVSVVQVQADKSLKVLAVVSAN